MSLLVFSALGCQHSPSRISVDALRVFSFGNLSKLSHCKCHFFGWKHLSNVAMFGTSLSHEAVFILATGFWNLRQLLETQKLLLWATDDKNASKHARWNQLFHFMSFPCNVKCLYGSSKVMETRKFGNSQAFFWGGNFRLLKILQLSILRFSPVAPPASRWESRPHRRSGEMWKPTKPTKAQH